MSGDTEILAPPLVPDHDLLRVIGRGSYGEVWLARNVMRTPRAVKVIKRHDFDYARPFEREFEGIQRYEPVSRSHEGLVHALHVGMGKGGDYFYYVMELGDDARAVTEQEGEIDPISPNYRPRTLRDEIERRGMLPVEECLEVGIVLGGALGHLHKCGLVHRDVKPSNIIYVNGRPKLADVGLVAALSDSRSMVGTEGYVAPEGTGQPRSDVFSLGRVLYECLTGLDRLKFPDVPDSWSNDADGKARFELLEIVLRAGDGDPKRRYQDTDEMLADLSLLRAGKSLRQLRRLERRLRRTVQVLALAGISMAVAAGAWALERNRRQRIENAEQAARSARGETQKLLGESLVAQAHSVRLSGQAGARTEALSAAMRARQEGAPLLDVRTQAASALGLLDVGEFSAPWPPAPRKAARTVVSEDGHFAATGFEDGKCRIFRRTAEGAELAATIHDSSIESAHHLFLASRGRWLAVIDANGNLTCFNGETCAPVWKIPVLDEPRRFEFTRDGDWAVLSAKDGILAVESATGARVPLIPGAPKMRELRLAPDGTWMAGLPDGEKGFRIYTGLPGGRPAQTPRIEEAQIDSEVDLVGSSISADGRYLAAAVGEDGVRVWEMASRRLLASLSGHQRTVRDTAFHPWDSSIVASTAYDGTTRLWDIPSRQQVLLVPAGGDQVLFARDRDELLLRTWSGEQIRWAPAHQRRAMRVLMLPAETPSGLVTGVAFSPDGQWLAAAGDAGVLVSGLATGQIVALHPAQKFVCQGVLFSPDGQTLWVSTGNGLYKHAVNSRNRDAIDIGPPVEVQRGRHRNLVWTRDRLTVTHGRFPSEGARDGKFSFISADGRAETVKVPHFADTLAVSPDGRWAATSNYPHPFGSLIDLDSKDRTPVRVDAPSRCTFAFLPHHPLLAIGSDRDVRFQLLPGHSGEAPPPIPRTSSEFIPARIALSPDASMFAVSTGPTEVSLYDARTLTKLTALESPLTPFDLTLAFSSDGHQLALAGGMSRVVIWDIAWLKNELAARNLAW